MAKRNAISPATPCALYEIHTDPATLYETFGPFTGGRSAADRSGTGPQSA